MVIVSGKYESFVSKEIPYLFSFIIIPDIIVLTKYGINPACNLNSINFFIIISP